MNNHIPFWPFAGLVLWPALAVSQGTSGTIERDAAAVVQKFAQLDFDGYRLDSEGHQAIWKLTIDDGAPPEFPVFIVKNYRTATPQKAADGSVRVPVEYDVIGLVSEGPHGLYFKSQPYPRKDIFSVKCTRDGCRIDLAREVFHVSPRVGKEAAATWLKGLEGIRQTQQERLAARHLYEQVKSAK
jgi:hypothetical protein